MFNKVILIGSSVFLWGIVTTGCCGGGDNDSRGELAISNTTPYFLHVIHRDEMLLYVPPGERANMPISDETDAVVVVAAGQEAAGRDDVSLHCCDENCGKIEASWQDGSLDCVFDSPECEEGSCPYVYVNDGHRFALQGEVLVGALNKGAARSDVVPLTKLAPVDGRYEVRLATELDETNYLNRVALEVVDHLPGTEIAADGLGRIHAAAKPSGPMTALDSRGEDRRNALLKEDNRAWAGQVQQATIDGKIRDYVEMVFRRPPDMTDGVLLVRGRNTQFLQDSYHSYLRSFGPGLAKLMRFTSTWRPYRPLLSHYLRVAGLGVDVDVREDREWKSRGFVPPVGPVGMRTTAVEVGLGENHSQEVAVRLGVLPGAWEIDSVRMSYPASSGGRRLLIEPVSVEVNDPSGTVREVDRSILYRVDDHSIDLPKGRALTATFAVPPAPEGFERTVLLHASGYYEEIDTSPRYCIDFDRLRSCTADWNSFGLFMIERLMKNETLNELVNRVEKVAQIGEPPSGTDGSVR